MEWGLIAISLGGLAVAALSLYLTYRERAAGLRGALYTKQIDVYGLLLQALSEQHEVTLAFITEKGFRLDGPSRAELRRVATPQVAQIAKVFVRNAVYLPKAVGDAIVEYRNTWSAISAPPGVEGQYPSELVYADDPQMELSNAFVRVWEAMAQQLGTVTLSEQTLRLFGTPQSK